MTMTSILENASGSDASLHASTSSKCSLVLPSLSPLSDRRKLRSSPASEAIVDHLISFGYDADWSYGSHYISSPASPVSSVTPLSELIKQKQNNYRPRTSSVTFFKSPGRKNHFFHQLPTRPSSSPAICVSEPKFPVRPLRPHYPSKIPEAFSAPEPIPEVELSASKGTALEKLPNSTTDRVLHLPPKILDKPNFKDNLSTSFRNHGPPPRQVSSMSRNVRPLLPITRGHVLMVFTEMDRDKNGKLTYSEFEEASISLGFSLDQAKRMFKALDSKSKGFLQMSDWGQTTQQHMTESFSAMYMRKFLGMPDITSTPEQMNKYLQMQKLREVKSLPAVINMVRVNALAKGSRNTTTSDNAIYEAFRFVDSDGSGDVSRDELRDAFFALNIHISENVLDQIMKLFDSNSNGTIDYAEFIRIMFPNAVIS